MHAHLLLVCALGLVAFGLGISILGAQNSLAIASSPSFMQLVEDTADLAETQTFPHDVRLILIGDIMLGRYVETLMRMHGWGYPFETIDGVLADADAVIGNLEGPIIAGPQTPDESLVFEFEPEVAAAMADHHITAVSIDNNHGLDQGSAGVDATRSHLAVVGITPFGDPREKDGGYASLPVSGYSMGLISINLVGARAVPQKVLDVVSASRDRDDLVIVFPHWGSEYSTTHSAAQEEQANELASAGANAVVGHHPHVVQDIQMIDEVPVIYSLGNFIFDQYFSEETERSLLVRLTLSDATVTFEFIPLISRDSQPALMDASDADAFLQAIAARSDGGLADAIRNGMITVRYPERVVSE